MSTTGRPERGGSSRPRWPGLGASPGGGASVPAPGRSTAPLHLETLACTSPIPVQLTGYTSLTEVHRLEELLQQDFSRMNRSQLLCTHRFLLLPYQPARASRVGIPDTSTVRSATARSRLRCRFTQRNMAYARAGSNPWSNSRPLEDSLGTPVAWIHHGHTVGTALHLDGRTRETGMDGDNHEEAIGGEDAPRFTKEGLHVIEVGEGQDRYHPRSASVREGHPARVALHQGTPSPARQPELIR